MKINKALLGFHEIADQCGACLEQEIMNCIEGKGLAILKCCGQGSDWATNMRGIFPKCRHEYLYEN